jgi:nucleoside-diphosphate-sugar epimerase
MIRQGKAPIVGSGEARRSMSYVDNTSLGLLLAAARDEVAGGTFWIADERPYSMNEIVDTVERLLERMSSGVRSLMTACVSPGRPAKWLSGWAPRFRPLASTRLLISQLVPEGPHLRFGPVHGPIPDARVRGWTG